MILKKQKVSRSAGTPDKIITYIPFKMSAYKSCWFKTSIPLVLNLWLMVANTTYIVVTALIGEVDVSIDHIEFICIGRAELGTWP